LKTDVFTVAKLRLNDEAAKIERMRDTRAAVTAGTGTIGDLMRIYEATTTSDTELKPSSIAARLVALKKVQKTWPGIEGLKPSRITAEAVQEWAKRFKGEGTAFTPPGSRSVIQGNSATSVNRAVDTLRRLLDIAVARGAIHANPVSVRPEDPKDKLKLKVKTTKWTPPSVSDVQRLFAAMENNGAKGGWGVEAADLCRFMAYSGCRVGEVPLVTWGDVEWDKKRLRVAGEKTETSNRHIPLFGELESLLKRIIERRKKAAVYTVDGKPMIEPTDRILRLSECQKTIDKACEASGIERLTHHDFRHLFATRCIEASVDIPTVSRWLGHSDGGALAMKTYGHLRDEHSQSQAAKVSFGERR